MTNPLDRGPERSTHRPEPHSRRGPASVPSLVPSVVPELVRSGGGRPRRSRRNRRIVVAVMAALLLGAGLLPVARRAVTPQANAQIGGVAAVQSLYAQDMVARINADRAARSNSITPVPPLAVDPGLAASAQAWANQLAASGSVSDPSLAPCGAGAPAGQVCVMAANAGDSGSGFWPGDGSDGMEQDFMTSTDHRQNELGAAYDLVGVGVACANSQAFTVEIFGYTAGGQTAAYDRQVAQQSHAGSPVAQDPIVAGTGTGDPVYCPGQTVGPGGAVTSVGGQYPYPYNVPLVPGEPNSVNVASVVGMAATPDGGGYWTAKAGGAVSAHGDANDYGSMSVAQLRQPIVGIAATPDGRGYWLAAADGGVFAFGDARFYGSMGNVALNAPVVGIAATPDGAGYWLVARDGGIFSFGDASFHGSEGGARLDAPVVGMASATGGGGYWLVGSDGGVFAFGSAPFTGSMGGVVLSQPVVAIARMPRSDNGYWLTAADGGIFAFGQAPFEGSAGGLSLNAPVVGMAADPATGGYWLTATDGGIFTYGAPFLGAG